MRKSICVVAPSYNHEQFIEQCIESIIDQVSDEYDLDLIIIDDASTDETVKIAKNFIGEKDAKKYFRKIHFIENKINFGAHYNYNRAIMMSDADIIHFMNTDDWIASNRIKAVCREYDVAVERNMEHVFWGFGKVLLVDEKNLSISGDGFWQYLTHVIDYSTRYMPSASFHLLRDNLAISTGNIFVSTALAKKINGFNNYKYVHDWDFILRCILFSEPFVLNALDSEYMYRHHAGNSFKKLGHIGHLESFEVLYRYFSNSMLRNPLNDRVFSVKNYGLTLVNAFLAENPAHQKIVEKVINFSSLH